MTPSPAATTGETWKIYHPNSSFQWASVTLGLVIFLPIIVLFGSVTIVDEYHHTGHVSITTMVIGFIPVMLLSVAGWRAAHRVSGIYLALSTAGIQYYAPGLVIKTSWDNVQELRTTSYAPVLVLRRRAATYTSIFYRRNWTTGKQIPLAMFDYAPQSAIARDLRAFAPHLFIQLGHSSTI
jgi:hypothetical protein